MTLEESKEADTTTGKAAHRVSRGIYDKLLPPFPSFPSLGSLIIIACDVNVIGYTRNCIILRDYYCSCEREVLIYFILLGHSFTRKLNSDGKVDSMQTLHNLEEAHNVLFSLDELDGFEKAWERNYQKYLPGWNEAFNTQGNVGKFLSGNTLSILY
ncbi:hypothetical protein GIB67_017956 [Kingdonia uniflora]|uniref:Uncharacterized protein n=1 Tax=Kingdonia uniflora TaxID=39325 RepID=A0A7J7MIH4_9MAGN|nr:hypothetical protein GIB67_017956 [Kingdonia uniflora]